MQLRRIDRGTQIATERSGVVVCVYPGRPIGPLEPSLRSLLADSAVVPIVLVGGAAPLLDAISSLELGHAHYQLYYLPALPDEQRTGEAPAHLSLTGLADVALVELGCVVPAQWLERLREAAHSDGRIATATPLSDRELQVTDLAKADAAVRSNSLRLRPEVRIPGRCTLVRRSALELTECSELALASDERERVAFAGRCVESGLAHVLADDTLVWQPGPDHTSDEVATEDPQRWALSRARRTVNRTSVVIDARILDKPTTGVQLHVLETIAALAETDSVQLTAVVPDQLTEHAATTLRTLSSVSTITHGEASRSSGFNADVVHRPVQLSDPGDLPFLASLGERLIVTQHDLIGFHNPSYFRSRDAWNGYRQLTQMVLGTADRVVFLSHHALNEALAEELVERSRATVVPNGVDHRNTPRLCEPTRPQRAAALPSEAEVILCLGSDYRHKNRLFALRMLERLQTDQRWPGYLVLAGPKVEAGSSEPEEAQWLATHPTIAPFVLDVGPVSEAEKTWLFERSRLVVYPTIYEGFGLVPFEAAEHGVPCMWAAGTALSEVLPEAAASIVAWNAAASAERALELLRSDKQREDNLGAVRAAGGALSWNAAATRLLEVYETTCDAPSTLASRLARRNSVLAGTVSEDAMRLVGPGGALPSELERPLLALATHPAISGPAFGALKLGYRLSYEVRRWRTRSGRGRSTRSGQRRR